MITRFWCKQLVTCPRKSERGGWDGKACLSWAVLNVKFEPEATWGVIEKTGAMFRSVLAPLDRGPFDWPFLFEAIIWKMNHPCKRLSTKTKLIYLSFISSKTNRLNSKTFWVELFFRNFFLQHVFRIKSQYRHSNNLGDETLWRCVKQLRLNFGKSVCSVSLEPAYKLLSSTWLNFEAEQFAELMNSALWRSDSVPDGPRVFVNVIVISAFFSSIPEEVYLMETLVFNKTETDSFVPTCVKSTPILIDSIYQTLKTYYFITYSCFLKL